MDRLKLIFNLKNEAKDKLIETRVVGWVNGRGMRGPLRVGLFASLLFASLPSWAQNKTPDQWKCENRISGKWTFGLAPSACDVSAFGEVDYVLATYGPLIVLEDNWNQGEQKRYVSELQTVLKESASLYIEKRNPEVTEAERQGFIHAILAVAQQESYWTHYRRPLEDHLKMMRGDFGHGHGLMQVDDRWHFLAIEKGAGWKLMDNMIYSMEEYYGGWVKSATASCVGDPEDYRARARSAYSAYNGGASKICRWNNPNDKWARNDKGYVEKYDQRQWESLVEIGDSKSPVNVPCLLEGNENCPYRQVSQGDWPQEKNYYQRTQNKNEMCLYEDGQFKCLPDLRDKSCLWSGPWEQEPLSQGDFNESWLQRVPLQMKDRHIECIKPAARGLYEVGALVEMQKNIVLRGSPAGSKLGVIPAGTRLQVYDFEYQARPRGQRFYQVFWRDQWGYIFGGEEGQGEFWLKEVGTAVPVTGPQWIARAGNKIKIVNAKGINLRAEPRGPLLTKVAAGTLLRVEQVLIQSASNEVYYEVYYNSKRGFIYSGQSFPEKTFPQWTQVIKATGVR